MKNKYTETMGITYSNVETHINLKTRIINDLLIELRDSTTMEEFMVTKKIIMMEIIEMLPLGSGRCPYCIHSRRNNLDLELHCENCDYGKTHGKCSEEGSIYYELMKSLYGFDAAIKRY